MPQVVRGRMIAAADRQGILHAADETAAELDIDRPGSLWRRSPQMANRNGRVGGCLGKTVRGGLRVGWFRATPSLIRKLVAARARNKPGHTDP